ncbi:lipopolysaccharide-induced tumor necrosis factor-alpha factor homolog [Paramormyrops kingsleyae]|uniref:Lipopolysaccharide-induced tumor necrosis factor-alpha factor homolog n=1 Tax=Paramormyrops kingsleyae TaxID=1676925 RepID=A0A3B3SPP1_9TELE|nr:lipopolysaccharide-induced tumor necrosis factor-alpha factor homolog [Paramormyrops kingsleyae]XP_023670837.1 lipopolysaccharide-induced tumor necrosis factor-alpha factor homolog [Paramormyrops kingsleyae]XP_023670838.1 lipopolysaccharide-induced tumor necrosis factor-alpha factor homolog [Paramormyrops kingsleyae]XP_023670839.1 lipopolysaccharide-induced tumor necrosis factor-alpha factor homolog [Paramormyrops kingsleyae]
MSDFSETGDETDFPPPYTIPVDISADEVRMYNLHTPFKPPPTTRAQSVYKTHFPTAAKSNSSTLQKFVSYETELGRSPGRTTCPYCQQQVTTDVSYKTGTFAWLMCLLFILCGLVIGCCLIPFFVKYFKDVYHGCPTCHQILHVNKKSCC